MSPPSTVSAKTYIPALDGLRGIAILVVVVSHYGLKNVIPGGFGVTLFFFISGFLITRLLLAEFNETQRVNLRAFYIRRLLRLYPALLGMVALSVLFTLTLGCGFQPSEVVSTLLYYRNYFMVAHFNTFPPQVECRLIYDITWSLSIEEHFYLFFPLLFVALARHQRTLLWVMGLTIVAVFAWRFYIVASQGATDFIQYRLYHSTDTRLDAIMYGCFMALWLHRDSGGRLVAALSNPFLGAGAGLFILLSFVIRDAAFREVGRYSLQGIGLSVLIPALLYAPRHTQILRWVSTSWLIYIGKLSYSIYLFHWLAICLTLRLLGTDRLTVFWWASAIAIGFTLSVISYYYVEKPTARLRKRFGSNVQVEPKSVSATTAVRIETA